MFTILKLLSFAKMNPLSIILNDTLNDFKSIILLNLYIDKFPIFFCSLIFLDLLFKESYSK